MDSKKLVFGITHSGGVVARGNGVRKQYAMVYAKSVSSVILVVGSAYIAGGALGIGGRGVGGVYACSGVSAIRSVIGIRVDAKS
jgi:hypothetical protein